MSSLTRALGSHSPRRNLLRRDGRSTLSPSYTHTLYLHPTLTSVADTARPFPTHTLSICAVPGNARFSLLATKSVSSTCALVARSAETRALSFSGETLPRSRTLGSGSFLGIRGRTECTGANLLTCTPLHQRCSRIVILETGRYFGNPPAHPLSLSLRRKIGNAHTFVAPDKFSAHALALSASPPRADFDSDEHSPSPHAHSRRRCPILDTPKRDFARHNHSS